MDVAKDEIVFFSTDSAEFYSIENSKETILDFLQQQKFAIEKTIIGCESTGDYHIEACIAALETGYKVKLINPILTKQMINATIRRKKTDYSDAQIIAKLLAEEHGEFVNIECFKQRKRTLMRTERKVTQCLANLKKVKKSLFLKANNMDIQDAIEAIDRCLDTLQDESKNLTKKVVEEQNRQEEIIDSIPGFGEKLSAIVSAEAGDIKRFPSARQFKAYVGIDPKVTQSGNSLHTGRITKSGNHYLRHALFLAANVSRQHDPELKVFYEKKKNEGKSHRHCVCAVSRKLCERIYAIVLKNELYQIKYE